jgi:nondiscriminating glutamyl-tRNA synthetase
MSSPVRVRFAPSPTGFLHLGGLRTALFNYLLAKKHPESRFILRIEDTDRSRTVQDAAVSLYNTLRWCGITFDESPFQSAASSSTTSQDSYFQSHRLAIYRHYAEKLLQAGDAYKCYCSRERLEALRLSSSQTLSYDGHCRTLASSFSLSLSEAQPFVVRLRVPDVAHASDMIVSDLVLKSFRRPLSELEDIVLLKSDGWPTYHFANVIDDHLMDITHVLRGQVILC